MDICCFYFCIFTANVKNTYLYMVPFLLCESFETQSRIVGGRVSSYSGLLYLAKLLSINEGCLTVCQLVLGVLLNTK